MADGAAACFRRTVENDCKDGPGAPPAALDTLQLAMEQQVLRSPRSAPPVLSSCSLQGIADFILSGRAKNIVVMAGAGISVSAGIPDFRTPGSGLYSQLQRFDLPWPEAVFDVRFFRHNPKPFYTLAKELFPGRYEPTPTHHFLRLLADKGLLLTAFTQNIDGLERLAGLPADKVVPAHGSFDGAHCVDCGREASLYAVQQAVFDDDVATCSSCGGFVKPDIVFFGEPLPGRFHRRRLSDLRQADLLIVMGTSLVVQPFASMIDAVPHDTPRLLLNMNRVAEQQQQPQRPQRTLCAHKLQQQRRCSRTSDAGSSCSSSDSDDSDRSCSDREHELDAGCESDATGLTASSSFINNGCSSDATKDGDDSDSDAGVGPTKRDGTGAAAGRSSSSGGGGAGAVRGFNFDAGLRDVAHLGPCDVSATHLAELLGWADDLEALIQAGRAEYEEAQRLWVEQDD